MERFLTDQAWTDYQANELLRAGIERQFEIIGEALNHLHATMLPALRNRSATATRSSGFATC